MKRIDIINDYSNHQEIRVKVQDTVGYEWIFDQKFPREQKEEVIATLQERYPDNQVCEYIM